jgi:hypothetical protein
MALAETRGGAAGFLSSACVGFTRFRPISNIEPGQIPAMMKFSGQP